MEICQEIFSIMFFKRSTKIEINGYLVHNDFVSDNQRFPKDHPENSGSYSSLIQVLLP